MWEALNGRCTSVPDDIFSLFATLLTRRVKYHVFMCSMLFLQTADISNPLGDDRFAAMFKNPDFQVDEESEVKTLPLPSPSPSTCNLDTMPTHGTLLLENI